MKTILLPLDLDRESSPMPYQLLVMGKYKLLKIYITVFIAYKFNVLVTICLNDANKRIKMKVKKPPWKCEQKSLHFIYFFIFGYFILTTEKYNAVLSFLLTVRIRRTVLARTDCAYFRRCSDSTEQENVL